MKQFFSCALVAALLVGLAVEDASAQRYTRKKRYRSIGVSLNAMNYFGDITPQSDFTSLRLGSTRPNIGVNYTKRLAPRMSVRANLFWGRIMGDDKKSANASQAENLPRNKRGLSFRNDVKELSVVGIIDLFENRGSYIKRRDFVPYAFAGLAVFHHNPKAYYDGPDSRLAKGWYALQPLGTEGQNLGGDYPKKYSRVQIAIPAGLGVRYKLDKHWDLAFEIGWRKTFTDYLDDVSGEYADKQELLRSSGGIKSVLLADRSAEELPSGITAETQQIVGNDNVGIGVRNIQGFGRKGNQRGDDTDKDWYIISGFNLTYILSPTGRAPKFR